MGPQSDKYNGEYDLYNEFYYATVCHVCKIKNNTLKSCKNCKVYRYCSAMHQRLHWPWHKKFCKIIKMLISDLNLDNCFNNRDMHWTQARLRVKLALEIGLGRDLTPPENQVWMFPRACAVCHETDGKLLFDCLCCPVASYCCTNHQQIHNETHSKVCSEMQLQYKYYCSRLNEESLIQPNFEINIKKILSQDITDKSKWNSLSEDDLAIVKKKAELSHILTVLHTMQILGMIDNNGMLQEKIVIHIIGATYEYDNFNRKTCEFLFHWFNQLKSLHLILIGPELEMNAESHAPTLCDSCIKKDIDLEYQLEKALYSNYCSSDRYKKPDFIAVFNCGFHEFQNTTKDSWKKSLTLLLDPKVPLLMTSYTHSEAVLDFERIKDCFDVNSPPKVIVNCKKNPYCVPLPLRDWEEENDIYYSNNYYSIIHSK